MFRKLMDIDPSKRLLLTELGKVTTSILNTVRLLILFNRFNEHN